MSNIIHGINIEDDDTINPRANFSSAIRMVHKLEVL